MNIEGDDMPAGDTGNGDFDVQIEPFDDSETHHYPPSGDDQDELRMWLLGPGMPPLQNFLRQYGVDRGNWTGMDEDDPIMSYVEGLMDVNPPSDRQELLPGPIRSFIGDMAVALLQELLLEFEEDPEFD
jgi:hypothetical protein